MVGFRHKPPVDRVTNYLWKHSWDHALLWTILASMSVENRVLRRHKLPVRALAGAFGDSGLVLIGLVPPAAWAVEISVLSKCRIESGFGRFGPPRRLGRAQGVTNYPWNPL